MQVLRMLRVAALAAVACVSVTNAAIDLSATPAPAEPTESPVVDILSAAGNATDLPGGNALCSADQRVRRPWGALDEDDQALYLEAVALAVENGALKQFADLYADETSGAQALFSSAFFLWHRRLVLGFESYLRDLDPKFACLTVPFYDIHTAYVRSATQECTSLLDCSRGFFEALSDETVAVDAPKRNDLTTVQVPASAGFTTFQRLVASTSDYASFLEGIQFGLHSDVRDAIGGGLASFYSPLDPAFYSWHGALDMYLHTYQLCRIGVPLSEDDFKNSTLVFTSAADETGGVAGVDASSKLLFPVTVDGSTVDIADHPTLGKYFASVGTDVWHYGDIQQLGDYSYTYELPEVLRQQLLTNSDICTGFARAFAATKNVKTTLSTASKTLSTKSTNVTTTKTVTTTVIRNGTKYTTTTTTKTSVRRNVTTKATSKNSTSTISTLKSFFSKLTSRFGYIFDLSGDDGDASTAAQYADGTDVTNGYAGYNAYDATGVLTTKHSGLVVADVPAGAASTINRTTSRTKKTTTTTTTTTTTKKYTTKTDATYRNVSTVKANVTTNGVASMRDVSASIATAGAYWRWLAAAYDGLKIRFEGNIDLVAQHLELLELQAYANSFGGVRNYSAAFVQSLGLTSARSLAGQTIDDIASGKLVMAATSANLSAKAVTFSNASVIQTLTTTYKRIVTRRRTTTYLNVTYIKKAEAAIKQAMALLVTKEATATKNGTSTAKTTATSTIAGGNMTSNSTKTVVAGGVKVTSNTSVEIAAGGNSSTITTSTETAVQLTPAPISTTKAPSTATPTTTAPAATSTTTIVPAATLAPSTPATTGASNAPAVTPVVGGTTVTVAPAVTPAASGTKPAATPAASSTKPAATPAASSTKPAVTPAASSTTPAVTPAASTTKPAATPAASTTKPAATPAASNIIKVVVTPAPTSPKLIC